MMRPLIQIRKKIRSIGKYIFLYVLISLFIVFIFSIIYSEMGIDESLYYSLRVFWGISYAINESVFYVCLAEIMINDLFDVVIVTCVLVKFLKPINPLLTSKYVIYNTKKQQFSFRYWVMLPEGKYLFDAKLRMLVTTPEAHKEGVNAISCKWQSKDEEILNLKQIRGIRFLELSTDESKELLDLLRRNQTYDITKDRSSQNRYEINFVISGYDDTGVRYYKWTKYRIDDILYGFQFVPLQGHEYHDKRFYDEDNEDEKFIIYKESLFGKKELFRYQHFDKVYPFKDAVAPDEEEMKKDILDKEQIIKGQYQGIKQICLDFCSLITMFFLDRSYWKARYIKRKNKK